MKPSLLRKTAENNKLEIMSLCIQHGLSLEPENPRWNPVIAAAENGHLEEVKLLVESGADLGQRMWGEVTALDAAVSHRKDPSMIDYLLAHTKDPFDRFRYGSLEEARAALNDTAEIVRMSHHGERTLLHMVVTEGDRDKCRLLLDQGADPNARDKDGNTPLNCLRDETEDAEGLVRMLLDHGADASMANDIGRTTVEHLRSHAQERVAGLLAESG